MAAAVGTAGECTVDLGTETTKGEAAIGGLFKTCIKAEGSQGGLRGLAHAGSPHANKAASCTFRIVSPSDQRRESQSTSGDSADDACFGTQQWFGVEWRLGRSQHVKYANARTVMDWFGVQWLLGRSQHVEVRRCM